MGGRSEKAIVKEIKNFLNGLDGCFCYKTHGGMYESLKGQPDISGCFYGLRFDFEVKKPGEEPTPLQKAVIRKMRKAGDIAGVVRSVDEVMAIMLLLCRSKREDTASIKEAKKILKKGLAE
ncbi:MAG: VRR-NUC domain-containing protein [Bacillota bacterium]